MKHGWDDDGWAVVVRRYRMDRIVSWISYALTVIVGVLACQDMFQGHYLSGMFEAFVTVGSYALARWEPALIKIEDVP